MRRNVPEVETLDFDRRVRRYKLGGQVRDEGAEAINVNDLSDDRFPFVARLGVGQPVGKAAKRLTK